MFPGLHLYFDCVGDECPQVDESCAEASLLLDVRRVHGDPVATVVHPDDEDAGLELDPRELAGVLEPLKPRAPLAGLTTDHT